MARQRTAIAQRLGTFGLFGLTASLSLLASAELMANNHHAHHSQAAPGSFQAQSARVHAEQRRAVIGHTQALMALQKQWAKAKGAEKAKLLEKLLAKAEARRQLLADLAEVSPGDLLQLAIPDDKQREMPTEVLALLEQQLELEGELQAVYDDYADNGYRLRHFLKTPLGETVELHLAGGDARALSGRQARVKGTLLAEQPGSGEADGVLVVQPNDQNLVLLDASTGEVQATGGTASGSLASNAMGERRTLVMMVNFQDAPNDKPWSRSEVESAVFDQTSNYFLEASFGQTWLSGDVLDWQTLAMDSSNCSSGQLQQLADARALANGVDPASYDHRIYIYPEQPHCGISGTATSGGDYPSVWINGSLDTWVIAHELGHNFGLGHSSSLECGTESDGDNCTVFEYGDHADAMGNTNSAHFNAFQKERLGWLTAGDFIEVTESGSFTLRPYEQAPDGTARALKVLRSVAANGQKNWFYLEYRQPIGFDSNLNSLDANNLYNGILVRHATEGDSFSSRLLDMTPDSNFAGFDWYDPALEAGYAYTDADTGISISTDWTDASGAGVSVSVGQPSCVTAAPTLALQTADSPWVQAGTTVSYELLLTNRDSNGCNDATFNLSANTPNGWSASFSGSSITLAPGASANLTLTVTSATSAADGFYELTAVAANGGDSDSATMTYVVSNPAQNSAPIAVGDSGSTAFESAVTLNVLANDSDPDGDALTVTSVSGVNGSAVINGDNSITYTPAAGFSGTEVFSYTISDGNGGSANATVNVTVAEPVANNQAPVAQDDSVSISGKTAVTISVLDNDADPDGDSLNLVSVTQGSKGSVRINGDGTLTYTPGKRFKNGDSFSYTITDGELQASAQVFIQLQADGSDGGGKGNKGKGNR